MYESVRLTIRKLIFTVTLDFVGQKTRLKILRVKSIFVSNSMVVLCAYILYDAKLGSHKDTSRDYFC